MNLPSLNSIQKPHGPHKYWVCEALILELISEIIQLFNKDFLALFSKKNCVGDELKS